MSPIFRSLHPAIGVTLVIILISSLRGFGIDAYVTVDERHWLVRSGNFAQAYSTKTFENTYQQGHPGVTVMWLGAFGFWRTFPDYADAASGQFDYSANTFDKFLLDHGYAPLNLLVAGRWNVLWLNSLLLIVTWWLLHRIFASLGTSDGDQNDGNATPMSASPRQTLLGGLVKNSYAIATLAVLLIGLHPFLVAHSRLLHPDSLLWSFMLISMLAYLAFCFERSDSQWRTIYLILSGIMAGLAWLTKTPGIYLALFIGVAWASEQLGFFNTSTTVNRTRQSYLKSLSGPSVWLTTGVVTFYLLWPAMWVSPIETLTKMFSISQGYAAEGHDSATFFAGQVINGDPGFWFYPMTYLWRASPVDLIGLVLALVWSFVFWVNYSERRIGKFCLILAGFSIGYLLSMSLGAKKFDRYLLPAYASLTIAACLAWYMTALWFSGQHSPIHNLVGSLLVVGIMAAQLFMLSTAIPVYLSYYNPLMGGSGAASDTMFAGWGQGLAEAAKYINNDARGVQTKVATWYGRGPLSYFLEGTFLSSQYYWQADYNVVYINQRQRQAPARQLIAHWNQSKPEYTVPLNGIDYAQVFKTQNAPLPRFVADWNRQIRLISYTLNAGKLQPGQELQLELYLLNLAPVEENLNMLVRFVNADGDELLHSDRWPFGSATSDWAADDLWVDRFEVTIPTTVKRGLYRIELRFYEPSSLEALPVFETATDTYLGETYILDYVQIDNVNDVADDNLCQPHIKPIKVILDGALSLQSKVSSTTIDNALDFTLCWKTLIQPNKSYTVFAHLVDEDNQIVAQKDQLPLDGFLPMWLWYPGLVIEDSYTLRLPNKLPPGAYTLRIGMYDADNGERLPISVGGEQIGGSYAADIVVIDSKN